MALIHVTIAFLTIQKISNLNKLICLIDMSDSLNSLILLNISFYLGKTLLNYQQNRQHWIYAIHVVFQKC